LLTLPPAGMWEAVKVGPAVINPKNDGPELLTSAA
jgi:hypothetical protein